jgi:hypothetical protein
MKDEAIWRIAKQTAKVLSGMQFFMSCKHLLPPYHALLLAARENHPDDPFLNALPMLELEEGEDNAVAPPQLNILFTQLYLALESYMGDPEAAAPAPVADPAPETAERRRQILEALREGKVTAEQATGMLENV